MQIFSRTLAGLASGILLAAWLPIGAQAQTAPAAASSVPATASGTTTPAPPPPAAKGPALAAALEAAQQALSVCQAREQKIAVSVVDSGGVLKLLLASDGASPRGVASSTAKALTALNFKAATSALGERAKSDKALAEQIAAGGPNNLVYNVRAGGLLIKQGDEVIGAIGVGGARGSEVDELCGQAGIDKLRGRWQ